jgi:cation transport ATPase
MRDHLGEEGVSRSAEHADMSMAGMVAEMRNRFLVAVLFSIPIVLWSPIGAAVFGLRLPVPFGWRADVWSLPLSVPVIGYSYWIFFAGAVRALRARTLDMMVLVAVAVGSGWLYSLVVTLTGDGDVFYEAATVLASVPVPRSPWTVWSKTARARSTSRWSPGKACRCTRKPARR